MAAILRKTSRIFGSLLIVAGVLTLARMAVLKNTGTEVLRLQACHPRFFATQRYIVDAKLVGVAPRGGTAYSPVRSASS
jgi:hypothetical protein